MTAALKKWSGIFRARAKLDLPQESKNEKDSGMKQYKRKLTAEFMAMAAHEVLKGMETVIFGGAA